MNTQHRNTPETLPLFPLDAGMETGIDVSGCEQRDRLQRDRLQRDRLQRDRLQRDRLQRDHLQRDYLYRDAGPDVDLLADRTPDKNRQTDTRSPAGQRIQPRKRRVMVDRGRHSVNPHLLAARKLSNKIKYLPDHSEAQTQTAQAICQHLRLLLAASEIR